MDGYAAPSLPEPTDPVQVLDRAERFIAGTGAVVRHGGSRAFYRPSDDIIQMPERERFLGSETSSATESYYATLLHELTHWTGRDRRCDRRQDLTRISSIGIVRVLQGLHHVRHNTNHLAERICATVRIPSVSYLD